MVLQLVITFKRDTKKLESVTSIRKDPKSKICNKVGLFTLVKGRLVGERGNLMIFKNHHEGKAMIRARKISG